MNVFPSSSKLYRTARHGVILASLALVAAHVLSAQSTRSQKVYKGPRALGLLELPAKGKAHLIPIAILIDGKFYDASVYKASPVPMALWNETVYEAERTGVSQGLFTVTAALENTKTNAWTAEGTWETEASILAAKPAKKPASSEPRGLNDESGPPVLRRRSGSESPKPASTQTPSAAPPATGTSTAPPAAGTQTTASNAPPATQPTPTASPASPSPAPSASSTSAASAASAPAPAAQPSEPEDKNQPVLRRGKPAPEPEEPMTAPQPTSRAASSASATAPSTPSKSALGSSGSAAAAAVQLIPAISDADGPEPRSYAYVMKPEEEEQYRKKMLALAADEIRARAKQLASEAGGAQEAARKPGKSAAKPVQPGFEDTQLHVFDLSASNEPVLVLTARAHMPPASSAKPSGASELQYIVTLVAREDINGDFHKAFTNVTDTQHLDVLPQYELIDAVDADGDGRGELLFRQVSDAGSAYVVYRVIGDQLWPLFQGTPQ